MFTVKRIYKSENSNEATVICNDESYHITVHDLETLELEEGSVVDEETLELLSQSVERLACIKKAFDFLSYGDLSEKQLRDKLCRKFPKELSADGVHPTDKGHEIITKEWIKLFNELKA